MSLELLLSRFSTPLPRRITKLSPGRRYQLPTTMQGQSGTLNQSSSRYQCFHTFRDHSSDFTGRWPGLCVQAALKMGIHWSAYNQTNLGENAAGQLTAAFPSEAMTLLTGLPAVDEFIFSRQNIWEWSLKAGSTPIILLTLPSATKLVKSHAYTVFGTSTPDGVQT